MNSVINPHTFSEFTELVKTAEACGADEIRFAHPSFLYKTEADMHAKVSTARYGQTVRTSQFTSEKNPALINIPDGSQNSPENMKLKLRELNSILKRINPKCLVSFYPDIGETEIESWYKAPFKTKRKCTYLYSSCYLSEIGDVYPCQFYPFSMGNITKESFNDIWNSPDHVKFRKTITKAILPGCARCCKLF